VLGAVRARKEWLTAEIITRNFAKNTCSCIFVTKRTLGQCLDDFPEAERLHMSRVRFEIDSTDPGKSVTTTLFGIFRGVAVYEAGAGCTQY